MGILDVIKNSFDQSKQKQLSMNFYAKYGDEIDRLVDKIEQNNEKAAGCDDPLKAEKHYLKAIEYAQQYKELCFTHDGGANYYSRNPYTLESIQEEFEEIKDDIENRREQEAIKKRIRSVLKKKINDGDIEFQRDLKSHFLPHEVNEAKRALDEFVVKGVVIREKAGSTYKLTFAK